MEARICSNCGGKVGAEDLACRHCGTTFQTVTGPKGSLSNAMFRAFLVAWSLTLPALCMWLTLTAPRGWGGFLAWLTNQFYFVPWITALIMLAVLTWVTEERR